MKLKKDGWEIEMSLDELKDGIPIVNKILPLLEGIVEKVLGAINPLNILRIKKWFKKSKEFGYDLDHLEEVEDKLEAKKEREQPKKEVVPLDRPEDYEEILRLNFNTFFNEHDQNTGTIHTLRRNHGWGSRNFSDRLAKMKPNENIRGKLRKKTVYASEECNFVLFIVGDRVVGGQESDLGFVQEYRLGKIEHFIPNVNPTATLGLKVDHHKVVGRGWIIAI